MVSPAPRDLVLFDIDGTLLRTAGAGREALDAAFRAERGWPRATEGVHIAGSIDDVIVSDVARARGACWRAEDTPRLRERYLAELSARCAEPGRARRCPGVAEILGALRGSAHVALLTGNWSEGARVKLDAAGLGAAFDWGVFSEDATTRDGLVPVARARASLRGLAVRRVVVVGDTPSDVACARAGGAVAVVVDTGFAEPGALARAGPDLHLEDLASGGPWLRALVAQGAGTNSATPGCASPA